MLVGGFEMYRILVCDDEKDIVSALKIYLMAEGYEVFEANNGKQALQIIQEQEIHLILMDLMMPVMDGITATAKLREVSNIPIIMLTAKSEDGDKVLGLNIGADDYITKPYNIPILLARVKAVLRRGGGLAEPDVVEAGGLRLSLTRGTVSADGRTAELSRNELRILAHLMTHAGEIVSRADLIEALWDSQIYIDDNTLSVNVTRLRGKLEALGVPGMIRTRRGMGYQYDGA